MLRLRPSDSAEMPVTPADRYTKMAQALLQTADQVHSVPPPCVFRALHPARLTARQAFSAPEAFFSEDPQGASRCSRGARPPALETPATALPQPAQCYSCRRCQGAWPADLQTAARWLRRIWEGYPSSCCCVAAPRPYRERLLVGVLEVVPCQETRRGRSAARAPFEGA